ncbi:MAG: DNA-formamidopyrimidine glycosylase family protein, partial [bacterium]
MPELPEVETLRRELINKIRGRVIKNIEVDAVKLINVPLKVLNQTIKNKKIKSVSRRAKVLILELANGFYLLIHLKLTGQLVLGDSPTKFTRIIFNFTDGRKLFFNDLRKFGWLKLLNQKQMEKELAGYGVEPLSQEFTLAKFKEILNKRKKAKIKPVLLDQKSIAGIGNIYADESCFYAKIKP